jgi:hypothetical protein
LGDCAAGRDDYWTTDRDRDDYCTADRDRDDYCTADRDRDDYCTADRDRDDYCTADRDRDSTSNATIASAATRSPQPHSTANRNRTAPRTATAPRPPQPRRGFSAPPTPASLARVSRARRFVDRIACRICHPTGSTTARNPTGRDLLATGTESCSSDSENRLAVRSPAVGEGRGRLRETGFRTRDARPGDDQ